METKTKDRSFLDSWHWHFADQAGLSMYRLERGLVDICEYRTKVMQGIFLIMVLYALGGIAVAIMVVQPLVWIAACIANGTWIRANDIVCAGASVCWGLVGCAMIAYGCTQLGNKYVEWKNGQVVVHKEPSMLTQMYRSWKDKVCYRIQIEKNPMDPNPDCDDSDEDSYY